VPYREVIEAALAAGRNAMAIGVVALPARVGHPDRKGKVESGVGHAQKTPLKGLRFETLEEAQAYLDRWEERWADTRIHGTTKRQVAALFAEEKPALRPLPVEPFRYYTFGKRTVHLDGCIEIEGAYYGPPPGWIGREIHVQWDDHAVRLLDPKTGWPAPARAPPSRARPPRRPPRRSPEADAGFHARSPRTGWPGRAPRRPFAQRIHTNEGEAGVRRIQGLFALGKKHGAATLDDACGAALEVGVPTYRFVKRYLERGSPLRLGLKQVDPLIRQLTEYRDLVDRMTRSPR
jgi:hypothetical protein